MNKKIQEVYIDDRGVRVTVLTYCSPRKSEKTWGVTRGSVSNMGAKDNTLKNLGYSKSNC